MSEWKVIADQIEIFPHPNADKMELGRVGSFQVVVGKGLYKTGDLVVFAPKRSILPADLRKFFVNEETGKSYLRGPNEDRVGAIRLRGEESEGVILPTEWVESKFGTPANHFFTIDLDLANKLGIVEYIPEIHSVRSGNRKAQDGDIVQKVEDVVTLDRFVRHDVEQFRIFQTEFTPGEDVIVTEKMHGTQINIIKDKFDRITVTSKGRAEHNLVLRRIPKKKLWRGVGLKSKLINLWKALFTSSPETINEYWKYAEDSRLIAFLGREEFKGTEIQIIGEVVPAQKGFSYGEVTPRVYVFRVVQGTQDLPYGSYPELKWVPLLYKGPYDLDKILPLAEGNETVSGSSLHIREGIVLSPSPIRKAKNGTTLFVKIINKKFKVDQDGEEIR